MHDGRSMARSAPPHAVPKVPALQDEAPGSTEPGAPPLIGPGPMSGGLCYAFGVFGFFFLGGRFGVLSAMRNLQGGV